MKSSSECLVCDKFILYENESIESLQLTFNLDSFDFYDDVCLRCNPKMVLANGGHRA